VDFIFVLTELFSQGFTAEALRANIYWKSAFIKRPKAIFCRMGGEMIVRVLWR